MKLKMITLNQFNLLTRPFVSLLKHMGCYDRYNNNKPVIERIVTKVLASLQDPEEVVGQRDVNNNEFDVDRFIQESDDWQPHNTENDRYKFVLVPLQDNMRKHFHD